MRLLGLTIFILLQLYRETVKKLTSKRKGRERRNFLTRLYREGGESKPKEHSYSFNSLNQKEKNDKLKQA